MGDSESTRAESPTSVRVATWTVRVAYLIVFVVNVQCAMSFIVDPESYAGAYELSGVAGNVAVQGMGLVFLMWNATYPAVIVNPRRFRAMSVVVLVQQIIGLVGESWIRFSLPAGHEVLSASLLRFIAFDGFGLAIMAATFIWLLVAEHRAAKRAEAPAGARNAA